MRDTLPSLAGCQCDSEMQHCEWEVIGAFCTWNAMQAMTTTMTTGYKACHLSLLGITHDTVWQLWAAGTSSTSHTPWHVQTSTQLISLISGLDRSWMFGNTKPEHKWNNNKFLSLHWHISVCICSYLSFSAVLVLLVWKCKYTTQGKTIINI